MGEPEIELASVRLERPAPAPFRLHRTGEARERSPGLRFAVCVPEHHAWPPAAPGEGGCGSADVRACARESHVSDGAPLCARWFGRLHARAMRKIRCRELPATAAEKDIPRPGVMLVCGGCGVRGTSPRDLAWPASVASRVVLGYHSSYGGSRAFGSAERSHFQETITRRRQTDADTSLRRDRGLRRVRSECRARRYGLPGRRGFGRP